MLDPGVGFGKTYEMNLDVMKHLDLFSKLGYPMLLEHIKEIYDWPDT